jgi:hypothetical protein
MVSLLGKANGVPLVFRDKDTKKIRHTARISSFFADAVSVCRIVRFFTGQ